MKRKIAAILAADVAGFSRLVAEDEEETLRRLAVYRGVFSDFVERFGGRIFNTAGDSVLAEFQSAVDAVRCAVDVQETLRTRNTAYPSSRQMNFRIGITIGDVVEAGGEGGGDLLGDGVNIAARLESLANPGGICVSRSVHEAVASKLTLKFADAGAQKLKNMPEPVYAFMVRSSVEPAPPPRSFPLSLPSLPKRPSPAVFGVAAAVVLAVLGGSYWALRAPDETRPPSKPEPTTAEPSKPEHLPSAAGVPVTIPPEPEPGATDKPPETPETTRPDATKPDTGSDDSTAAPAPGSDEGPGRRPLDTLTSRFVLTRLMQDCREGAPSVAAAACRSLVAEQGFSDEELSDFHYRFGRALREEKDPDGAIKSYDEAIRLHPMADAYLHRGVAHYDKGETTAAIDDLTEALKLDPRSAEAANNRAWIRFKAGDPTRALTDADLAVRLDSTLAYVWDTRGNINEALGKKDAAIRDYRKALSIDSGYQASAEALQRLGASP